MPPDPIDRACRLCGSATGNTVVLEARHLLLHDVFLDVALCDACGSAWFPDIDAHRVAYPESGDDPDLEMLIRHYLELAHGLDWKIGRLEPLLPARSRTVLEVGCGVGVWLDYCRTMRGAEVAGLEPSTYGRHGRRLLDLPIVPATMPTTELGDRRFDLVMAIEVIEHVADPGTFLAELRSRTAPGGLAVLTTPRPEALARSTPPGELYAALSAGSHYFLASAEALTRMARAAGFGWCRVEAAGFTNIVLLADDVPAGGPSGAPAEPADRMAAYYRSRLTVPADPRTRLGDLVATYVWDRERGAAADTAIEERVAAGLGEQFDIDLLDLAPLVERALDCRSTAAMGRVMPYSLPWFLYWRGQRDDLSERGRTELWEAGLALAAHGLAVDPVNLFLLRGQAVLLSVALGGRVPGGLGTVARERIALLPADTPIEIVAPGRRAMVRATTASAARGLSRRARDLASRRGAGRPG